jgi:hypothetical protein
MMRPIKKMQIEPSIDLSLEKSNGSLGPDEVSGADVTSLNPGRRLKTAYRIDVKKFLVFGSNLGVVVQKESRSQLN